MDNAYLQFDEAPSSGKTKIWIVKSKISGVELGQVKWYGAWRNYCFFPYSGTIFDTNCMQSIVTFIKLNEDTRNPPK